MIEPAASTAVGRILAVRAPALAWALPAARVRRVVLSSEWTGAEPFDVLAYLGLPSLGSDDQASVVLVVEAGQSVIPLKAHRHVETADVAAGAVMPLPEILLTPAMRSIVEGIVVGAEERHPIFVLAPEALERAART